MVDNSKEKIIDGELFASIIENGAKNLKSHLQEVNDLNVFPIPDGDTGDNMYMTISGGISPLKKETSNDVDKKAKALANGMLLNARGNSGVILSQLFAGMAKSLEGHASISVEELAVAFNAGVKQAYTAVAKPVEGTILTVAREAADVADKKHADTVGEYFATYVKEMEHSLEHTPDLLPVLKEADVVDSGGAGLLYIAKGMKSAVEGKEIQADVKMETSSDEIDFSKFTADSEMVYGYCTECLLQLQNKKTDAEKFDVQVIIDFLNTVGDSIVAFKTGTVIKLHVHTLTPYKVLQFCQQYGEFLKIKIENMTLQHNESVKEEKPKKKKRNATHRKFGLVTVGTGEGLIDAFYGMGADIVVDGGQGNNPSIETFIEAFDDCNADVIFVLPNNSNIIMAASQAKDLYKNADVRVIPTKNFGQAYAILSMLDYTSDNADTIEENMKSDMADVVTGMITTSIRDANIDGVEIANGEYIGFTNKTMLVSKKLKTDTFSALLDKLDACDKNFVIVFYGKDVTKEEKDLTQKIVTTQYPDIEFYSMDGGQDVYDYIIILE